MQKWLDTTEATRSVFTCTVSKFIKSVFWIELSSAVEVFSSKSFSFIGRHIRALLNVSWSSICNFFGGKCVTSKKGRPCLPFCVNVPCLRFRIECPDGKLTRTHLKELFQKVFPDGNIILFVETVPEISWWNKPIQQIAIAFSV